MIIGLNGRMRSGKDTVAEIIAELHPNVQRIAFADKLKQSAAALLGVSVEFLELLKTTNTKLVLDPDPTLDPELYNEALSVEMTMRAFLQRYGTEAHREVFSDNFWIEQALPPNLELSETLYVVTDMRFPNEVDAVRARGGVTVKIKRPEVETTDTHASEQFIPNEEFDFVIVNDRSLDELHGVVREMMDTILIGAS